MKNRQRNSSPLYHKSVLPYFPFPDRLKHMQSRGGNSFRFRRENSDRKNLSTRIRTRIPSADGEVARSSFISNRSQIFREREGQPGRKQLRGRVEKEKSEKERGLNRRTELNKP